MRSSIEKSGPIVYRRSKRRRRFSLSNPHGLDRFGKAFSEVGDTSYGRARANIADLMPALSLEPEPQQDAAVVVQDRGPAPAVQALAEPIVDSRIGALYAPHFRRLEQELQEFLKRQELEAVAARSSAEHLVPDFVDYGLVPQVEVDAAGGVGNSVLLTVLEKYERPANVEPK